MRNGSVAPVPFTSGNFCIISENGDAILITFIE